MKTYSKKYVVFPGEVGSSSDGDTHFIGFMQLVRLYDVVPNECINGSLKEWRRGFTPEQIDNFIYLHPRPDGNYKLPDQKDDT